GRSRVNRKLVSISLRDVCGASEHREGTDDETDQFEGTVRLQDNTFFRQAGLIARSLATNRLWNLRLNKFWARKTQNQRKLLNFENVNARQAIPEKKKSIVLKKRVKNDTLRGGDFVTI
ncbi:hypothetical protein BaRGS_00025612, partial [Batillaria attramentaria]